MRQIDFFFSVKAFASLVRITPSNSSKSVFSFSGPADVKLQHPMAGSADQVPFVGRVLKPFSSQLEGELSLTVGELALVTVHNEDPFLY